MFKPDQSIFQKTLTLKQSHFLHNAKQNLHVFSATRTTLGGIVRPMMPFLDNINACFVLICTPRPLSKGLTVVFTYHRLGFFRALLAGPRGLLRCWALADSGRLGRPNDLRIIFFHEAIIFIWFKGLCYAENMFNGFDFEGAMINSIKCFE